jgi:S1-C subfamily serine protease
VWLRLRTEGGEERAVELTGDRFVIGRDEECDLVLDDDQISRRHTELDQSTGRVVIRDLDSRNGTFVNGKRIHEPTTLDGNEQLRFGNTVASLSPSKSAPTVLAGRPTTPAGGATPTAKPPGPPPTPFQGAQTPRSSQSRIERLTLQRSARRASIIAVIALLAAAAAIAAGVLFAVGVLPPENEQLTVAEIVDQVEPSTVLVRLAPPDGEVISSGTGWVLDADEGLIVTNHHVVSGGTRFSVSVGGEDRRAQLIAAAPCEDLAVLRVDDTKGLTDLPLGDQSMLEQGDDVVALGYPRTAARPDKLVATRGVVSQVRTLLTLADPRLPNVVQTDAAINPGNSGGPLVNGDGELVGVNTVIYRRFNDTPIESQGYAIGVARVETITDVLRQGRGLAWNGMNFQLLDQGIAVTSAVPGTPADVEGFGDDPVIIIQVNGRDVNSLQTYCQAVGDQNKSGDSARFTVRPIVDGQIRNPVVRQVAFK